MINWTFIREVGPFRWTWRTAIRQFYKRVLKRDHGMKLPTGEWLNLPITDHFASEAFITGADVDWGSEALFASLLMCRGAFLDVGAHIGYYSLYMLPLVREVYSFEPDPRVCALLEENVRGRERILVIPWAVGERPGRARFTLEAHSEVSHLSTGDDDAANRIVVQVVTVDQFAGDRNLNIEAIKIDVEGHDAEVIRGALGVMRHQQPLILTEAEPNAELFDLTRIAGYRVFAFVRPRVGKRRFMELVAATPPPGKTKMLFLAPERLFEEFQSRL